MSAVFAGVQSLRAAWAAPRRKPRARRPTPPCAKLQKREAGSRKDAKAAKRGAKKSRKAEKRAEKRRQKSAEREAKKAQRGAGSPNAGDDYGRPTPPPGLSDPK